MLEKTFHVGVSGGGRAAGIAGYLSEHKGIIIRGGPNNGVRPYPAAGVTSIASFRHI